MNATRKIATTCLALLSILFVQGQTANEPIANRGYYRTLNAGSIFMHTRGVGVSYQRGWRTTGTSNRIMNFELLTLRHPKEHKINGQGGQNSRSYFYGKINSVALIRGSYGWQKVLFDKEVKRGVRVSYLTMFGPTVGLAKPVYVEYFDPSGEANRADIVRYSTSIHNNGVVLGRAPILYKVTNVKLYPGGHARFILNFEYSSDDSFIKAIETGANLDIFARKIPIMENTYNDQFYFTLFVGFQFGKRYL